MPKPLSASKYVFSGSRFRWPLIRRLWVAAMLRDQHCERILRAALIACASALLVVPAGASTCKTESQLAAPDRDALSNAARGLIRSVQSGDVQSLQANT